MTRRRRRGFDLIQLIAVVALIGVLTATAFAVFREPVDEVSRTYLRETLRVVDVELRDRARHGQSTDVTVWFDQVLGTDDIDRPDCPTGGVITIPVEECDLPSGDPDRFRLVANATGNPPTVTLVRFGRCEQLLLDPDGVARGEVVACDPETLLPQ